jgi:hypothetical protein
VSCSLNEHIDLLAKNAEEMLRSFDSKSNDSVKMPEIKSTMISPKGHRSGRKNEIDRTINDFSPYE